MEEVAPAPEPGSAPSAVVPENADSSASSTNPSEAESDVAAGEDGAAAASGGGVVYAGPGQAMVPRLGYAETLALPVGFDLLVVTELNTDEHICSIFFTDTDDYNVKITLTRALERQNACLGRLVRTETGFGIVLGDELCDEYDGFAGKDGWTEAAALCFGRIVVDAATATADPDIATALINAVLEDEDAKAAAAGLPAPSLGGKADSATAVVAAPEPGAPLAAAQPAPAGPTAPKAPAIDSGGDTLAAVAAAAERLEPKEPAESRAAAELAELKKSKPEAPGGAGDAGGAGGGKRPSGTRPKPQTNFEKEQALSDKLRSIHDRRNELLKHDPKTPDYLTDVVRLHCATPAFGACCGAILTMFRCHGRAQVALEHNIASTISNIDKPKQTEFRAFIKELYDRVPPPPKP